MSEPIALTQPMELTEKAHTPGGVMRIVLDAYPSGALSVALIPDSNAQPDDAPLMLSAEPSNRNALAQGEFVAANKDAALTRALFRKRLFRSTGRQLEGAPIWSLDGLAMIEFLSAFQPPLAASKVSFPAHLFDDKEFEPEAQKRLIQSFETNGYTRHSARGAAVWVLKQHCEKQKQPFIVYLLQEQDATVGVLVCKRSHASAASESASDPGQSLQIVYESPRYS